MTGKKRLIMVQHADGRDEYSCPKCGGRMEHRDTAQPNFTRGEFSETGGEFLQCTNPECQITSDYPKLRVKDFKHCQPGF